MGEGAGLCVGESPIEEFGENVNARVEADEVEPGLERTLEDGVTGGDEKVACFLGVANVVGCDFGDGGEVGKFFWGKFGGSLTGTRNVTLRFCPDVISQDKGPCDI